MQLLHEVIVATLIAAIIFSFFTGLNAVTKTRYDEGINAFWGTLFILVPHLYWFNHTKYSTKCYKDLWRTQLSRKDIIFYCYLDLTREARY